MVPGGPDAKAVEGAALATTDKETSTGNGPTPEQQADYLVRKLEQTIRDKRTVNGMSFATWQAIAREELTNALKSSERRHSRHNQIMNRLIMVSAAAVVTAGFWGAAVAINRDYGLMAGMALMLAGGALLFVVGDWAINRATIGYANRKRGQRLDNIEDMDRRIKRMEADMKKKLDQMKDKMEEFDA